MAVGTFEEIRQKKKVPSFEELRGGVPSFKEIREQPEFEEQPLAPLLTGADVPEAYRRMGVTEYRPSSGDPLAKQPQVPKEEPFGAFQAMPEKTFWQKAKGFFVSEPRYGRWTKPTRLDYLHKALDLPLSVLTKYSGGRALGADKLSWYALTKIRPDLANKPLEEQMAELSPYEKSGFQKVAGEIAEFIGQIQTSRKLLRKFGWKSPKGTRIIDRIARNAPPWMTSGAIDALVNDIIEEKDAPEVARNVVKSALIRGGEAVVWSGLEWGAGKAFGWALKKFPRFKVGWDKWVKGKSPQAKRTARQEVDEALKHYRKTGDRTAWDNVRIKYAGIKPEGVERIRARAAPPPVKEFGKYPLAKATARPPVAKVAPTPTVPPKPTQAKPEAVAEGKQPWEMTFDDFKQVNKITPETASPPVRVAVKVDGKIYTTTSEQQIHSHVFVENKIPFSSKTAIVGFVDSKGDFIYENAGTGHIDEIKAAIASGKPVPRHVLEEHKGEKWAQEALAKPPAEGKGAEVKAKVPEGEISRQPVTVEDKKYYPIALPVDQIGVDAEKFQFKLGAKLTGGVTEALKGVEKFDPVKGGQILVWQDKAGKYWVVDGHHRVALAKKTGAERLETWVVREADGVTEQKARAIGALRNLADGKGTAVDAAKLFRDSDISLEELRKNAVPTNSVVVQQGLNMADLSDEVFRLVVDDRLPANMAAAIGKQVKNPAQQKQVADLILEGEVETLRQAELLAATIDSAPILTKTEQTLFGLETTEKSLYAERAKVLANVEQKLKTNKKVFGVLATQTGIIEAKGNILAKVENLATKEKAEEVLFMLEKLASAKGPVAEALNDATKQYAENPTKENLSKVTNVLLERWTEGPGRLRIPERKGVSELPLERAAEKVKPKPKGKPGFIDVRPLQKAFDASLKLVEPAKIAERAFGKTPSAIVIKGIHQADVGRIEFNEAELETLDRSLGEFGEKLSKYSNKVLKNLMAARGKPIDKAAVLLKNEALKDLAKEAPELVAVRKMITKIADHNYKYLQSVVGDDIHYVEDYFYGIYKNPEKVERFLDYWKTTKRFTKEKKLPTVADALSYGLELRNYNPVNNLRAEYQAIARLDGMIYMRDELMRTGKGRYIDTKEEAPHDWEKIKEPVFKDVRVHPELAAMIKSLLSTNKLRRGWFPRGLTQVNNALRTLKFAFSMFHHLNILKQSVADEGYLKFLQPSATRGVTRGFKKSDPIFRTPAYKDYIKHGGGHRYSIESQAVRAVSNFVESLDRRLGMAFKVGALPIRIPKAYVKWLFQSYIPKVKYSKYLDSINQFEQKNERTPTSAEKIEIIKEQQNFYGMMNERLFGRSGTVTSAMRLWYMSPGYYEGNLRTELKSILQWGGKDGHRANRSRSNVINSLILTGIIATVGTLILTGKPPKKPETLEDIRDLFKIDTGKTDDRGRRIMIDMMTYDKDYWNLFGNVLIGRPDKAAEATIKRTGGMVASSAQVALDIANLAAGRALIDWKNDRVVEITDPFARKVLKVAIHEINRIEPISVSVFQQSRKRDQTRVLSALTSLLGYRPTLTEKDKREQQVLRRIYSLKGQQEELYQYLATIRNPRKAVERHNKTVDDILSSPMIPPVMRKEWEPKLRIDVDRYLENRAYYLSQQNRTTREIERTKKILENFGVTPDQAQEYINRYWARDRKRTVSPLESHRVIGRMRKRRRLKERMGQ